jgi:hypothetical protein
MKTTAHPHAQDVGRHAQDALGIAGTVSIENHVGRVALMLDEAARGGDLWMS